MNETWKKLSGFDYEYEVSNLGRIRKGKKILNQHDNGHGYLRVVLPADGKWRGYAVHRIIAKLFINNPSGLETVNHKNCDRKDNEVNNLEWMSMNDNRSHAVKMGLFAKKLTAEIVKEIRGKYVKGGKTTLKKLAKEYGIYFATVWEIVNYKIWKEVPNG